MHAVFRSLVTLVTTMTLLQSSVFASETPPTVKTDTGSHQLAETEFCPTWVRQSERLNGRDLARAAYGCFREGKRAESVFLIIAGQVRFFADSGTHMPVDDDSNMRMEDLSRQLPASVDGPRFYEVFRDPALQDRLFNLLESWRPVFYEGYHPGWEFRLRGGAESYRERIGSQKEFRLRSIRFTAKLIARDDYYELNNALNEFFEGRSEPLTEGSDDYRRAEELVIAMAMIAEELDPSLVVPGGRDRFNYEPDPNANFKQLHVGWNGPSSVGVVIFENEMAVKSSWLSRALTDDELRTLLSDVDFTDQILVAFAAGEQEAATGSLYLTDLAYDSLSRSLRVTGKVGEVVRGCPISSMNSYPFAVAVADKPSGEVLAANAVPENVNDGCRSPVVSLPNN